jgi:iron complex outermembrane recepter protein
MAGINGRTWFCLAICAALGESFLGAAHAAETATPEASSDSLQEVVITAERRTQNIQTTSIAMTALSAEDVANKGVRDQTDLQFAAPSLSMTQVGFTENVNIRGIGINLQSPVVVSGVALYRDGLFYPGNIMADEPYYDVADVEILRGPQGTFVGQNSTGGAILVTSRNPTLDGTHADVEAQTGNYQEVQVRGAVNVPLSETWGARVAFNHESRNSFFDNVQNRLVQPGKVDQTNMRLSLMFAPNDSFTALWKSEYNTNSTDG